MRAHLPGFSLFASKVEFDAFLADRPAILEGRRDWSRQYLLLADSDASLEGWCSACGDLRSFLAPEQSAETAIDFRESLVCQTCELNARSRVVADLALRFLQSEDAKAYTTEQTSFFYRWFKRRIPGAIGSEYFEARDRDLIQDYISHLIGPDEPVRFEDVTRLGLADRSIDLVISSDVLEHVPDHRQALAEFFRVLRPGGRLVVTVPFAWDRSTSLKRAIQHADGRIEHLLEPEYHGDPMSEAGILAFHTFGWDLLDSARSVGFERAHWALAWQPSRLYLADLWVMIAE
jgi:SAM-dependent methyltransferase